MRATVPAFDYYAPDTIPELLNLLGRLDSPSLIAGGTDFIPAARLKGFRPANVVSLRNLGKELSYVTIKDGLVRIGALTKIIDAQRSELVCTRAPCLHEALSQIGSVQIRNRATIGGNLCNASPAADSAPPLLVLNASVETIRQGTGRTIPLKDFFLGPGKTALEKAEVLKEVAFRPQEGGSSFEKLGRTNGEDISVASAAVLLKISGSKISEGRIALGSVAPMPMRALQAEKMLSGKEPSAALLDSVASMASDEAVPVTDVRATAEYRKSAVKALVRSAFGRALERARGG